MAETTYKRIEAVLKAIGILEFLATQKEPSTCSEIARAVEIPTGTVMCQLVTMQDRNFVRKIGGGWELGMGAAMIWARKKAQMETEVHRIGQDIQQLEGGR